MHRSTRAACEARLSESSIFVLLARQCHRLFPDEAFADLFAEVGRKRVLDSTALYDAVATQDTVTLIRSSIRALLRVAPAELQSELRAVLERDDDYLAPGKPSCDWDDAEARAALVDALARDAHAVLGFLHGRKLLAKVNEAAQLVATVVGQDLEQGDDGLFRIAQRVARDRVISTVDPEARHGHKTSARGFDGYKGHISVDPDSEIIIATEVTAGNVADGAVAEKLLAEGRAQVRPHDAAAPWREAGSRASSRAGRTRFCSARRGHQPRAAGKAGRAPRRDTMGVLSRARRRPVGFRARLPHCRAHTRHVRPQYERCLPRHSPHRVGAADAEGQPP